MASSGCARRACWGGATLVARIDDVGAVDAKLRLRELHDRHRLTELEEAWVVRSLYREDWLPQPEIARRMNLRARGRDDPDAGAGGRKS